MDAKVKHLEIIQGVINRMAHCSFLLKGWSVILLSGLFALAAKEANSLFVYLACLPIISFWVLDGYYLYQERLYRKLYNEVRNRDPGNIDFDMSVSRFEKQGNTTWLESMRSKTTLLFHGILVVTVIIVMIICIINQGGANG